MLHLPSGSIALLQKLVTERSCHITAAFLLLDRTAALSDSTASGDGGGLSSVLSKMGATSPKGAGATEELNSTFYLIVVKYETLKYKEHTCID